MWSGWLLVALATFGVSTFLLVSDIGLGTGTRAQSITVGTPRYGDLVVYDGWDEALSEDGTAVLEQSRGKFIHRIEGPNWTGDQWGLQHKAFGFVVEWFDPANPPPSPEWWITYLDEETRQPFRREIYIPTGSTAPVGGPVMPRMLPGVEGWPTYDVAKNRSWVRYNDGWLGGEFAQTLAFGRTLTVGDDLSGVYADPLRTMSISDDWKVNATLRVEFSGRVDDAPVVGLVFRTHYTGLGDGVVEWEAWENLTSWFADGGAYPVRFDYDFFQTWQADAEWESARNRASAWRASLKPGTVPVALGEFRFENLGRREPTFGPDRQIVNGGSNPYAYSFEEALANVHADPSLVAFNVWKLRNPGWLLIGARSDPASDNPFVGQPWEFGFSVPGSDEIFTVNTVRDQSGQVVNHARVATCGMAEDERFNIAWLPERFPTLAYIDSLWRTVAPADVAARGANFFDWGYEICHGPSFRGERWFRTIFYGRADEIPGPQPLVNRGWNENYVVLDADTAEIKDGYRSEWRPTNSANVPLAAAPRPDVEESSFASYPIEVKGIAAASAGLSLLVIGAYLYPLLHQGVFTLYSKLVRHQLLDHELRDELLQAIQENPGVSPPQLKAQTGAGWTTIIYHLGVLRDNGMVTSIRDGRHRRYFRHGAYDHRSLPSLALLQNPRTRQIRDLIGAQPGIERPAMARLMGITPAAVTWHLKRLMQARLVQADANGRQVRYFVLPAAEAFAAPRVPMSR